MAKHADRYILALVLVSLAIRVVYYFQFQGNPFFEFVPKAWDQTVYHEGGLAFAHGNLLAAAPNQTNLFSPLYQYFIGFIYRFLLDQVRMVWIVQFGMGTVSTILVYKIAHHYFEPVVGFVAGLLFTFHGANWFYEGMLYREALITFLSLSTFYLLIKFARSPTRPLMILSALALSLLMQSRANNVLMVPVALVYLSSLRTHEKGKQFFAGYLLTLIVTAIPLLAWGYVVRGFWAFYEPSGPAEILLAGNTLDYPGRGFMHTGMFKLYQENAPLTTMPVVRFILKTAWEQPWEFLLLYLRKLYFYFNSYEIPNSLNFYIFQEFAPVLEWGVPFALIGSLGLVGSVLSWRLNAGVRLLHAWFFTNLLMVLPFCISTRYRLPAVPILSILAAYALWFVWTKARERRWMQLSAVVFCVALLGWAERTDPLPEGKIRIRDHINFGAAFLENSHPEDDFKGYEFYKRAWELSRALKFEQQEPEVVGQALANYHYKMGLKALSREDTRQAIEELKKSIHYNYAFADAHFLYASILGDDNFQALLEALQAAVLSPDSPEAHLILGSIYQDLFGLAMPAGYHLKTALESLPVSRARGPLAENIQGRLEQLKSHEIVNTKAREEIRALLQSKLPPLPDTAFDLSVPDTLQSSAEIEAYLILLYQYLTLMPGPEDGKIYLQIGALYLKKIGMQEAAYVYLQKAWDKGIQNQAIGTLLNDLQFELSARPIL